MQTLSNIPLVSTEITHVNRDLAFARFTSIHEITLRKPHPNPQTHPHSIIVQKLFPARARSPTLFDVRIGFRLAK